MSFILLPTGTLHKKTEKKRLNIFPAGYVGRLHRNLADNVDNFLRSDFYERIVNDYVIPSEDVQKYVLVTSDFAKGMQTDMNNHLTKDRISNTRFRQKLDPISKSIIRRQNLLELVFEDISKFDAENPIVGSLLRELDIGKKDVASEIVKKAPRPPGVEEIIRKRLDRLKDRAELKDDISPPPSPPSHPLSSFHVNHDQDQDQDLHQHLLL